MAQRRKLRDHIRNEDDAHNAQVQNCHTINASRAFVTLSSGPTFFRLFIFSLVHSQSQSLFSLSIATHWILSLRSVVINQRDDRRLCMCVCGQFVFLLLHFNKMYIDGDRKNVCLCARQSYA